MADKEFYNSTDCIEKLISKQEKYPYYYWFIWIFFLVLFAGVLGIRAASDFDLNKSSIKSRGENMQNFSKSGGKTPGSPIKTFGDDGRNSL